MRRSKPFRWQVFVDRCVEGALCRQYGRRRGRREESSSPHRKYVLAALASCGNINPRGRRWRPRTSGNHRSSICCDVVPDCLMCDQSWGPAVFEHPRVPPARLLKETSMDSRIDDALCYEAPHVRRWRRACSLASSLPAPHAALVVFKLRWRSATMPETLRSEDPSIRQSRADPVHAE